MMEHENERMSYSFEPSDESSGAQGYHQTSYDPNYNQNEHKNPKKNSSMTRSICAVVNKITSLRNKNRPPNVLPPIFSRPEHKP